MPSIFHRIFSLYNLLNSFILFIIPKNLRPFPSPPNPKTPLSNPKKRMNANDLKNVFQMFDKNGDGRITKSELNNSLENMGIFIPDKELTQMIENIDVDGDGCVDIDEFRDLYSSILDEKDAAEEENMKEAFDVFDQNGDGFISVDELKSVLAALGLKQGRSLEDCKSMINKVDVDGDGRVNFNEFMLMMKGGGFTALS
ncbi:Calmodulin-like protein 5 [Euphorbia peplus]|nr:Calmodulin-like protein 5 [Euphorbia peplus]